MRGGAGKLLVYYRPACGKGECTGSGPMREAALENRKRGVQHAEKAGIPSGTPIQQKLSGVKEPLLPDTDRSYDCAGHGSMGNAVETDRTEQGAEAQEDTGII